MSSPKKPLILCVDKEVLLKRVRNVLEKHVEAEAR